VAGGIRGRWRPEGPEAPFVGRADELALLKDLYHATAREQRARLVSVVGPAGIGKSRLGREFLNHVDAEAEDFWLHHGRSPAYGEGLTFWALGEMVRQRAGLAETDDEATTRSRIHAMVEDNVPDEADRRWIEPAMLTLLGVSGGETDTEQLFGAWRTFFERLAAVNPVVLVFEDLHWADSGMLDFIDYLLEWSRAQPIFILTLARPELIERRATWGAGKRQFTSVYLEPLPEPAIRELLAGLVPGLPDTAAKAIAGRADGIPLYAVETVRMLVADGRLVEEGGVYTPSGDLSQLAVPESLTALIASRLDALEPEARTVAQDASVLGQRFTVAGLGAVTGLDPATLEPLLATLLRREMLTLETDPRSPERNQYGFVQSLIREVAYNTLARRDRKNRHLAAARFFESLETEELAGALAGQYLPAHANADGEDEKAALAAQARVALKAAAERALGLGAPNQAYEFLQEALALAQDSADEAELALRGGQAANAAGRYNDGDVALRRAIDLFSAHQDQAGADRAVAALASNLNDSARFTDAIELLEPLVQESVDFASRPGLVAAGAQLARAHMLRFETVPAVAAADLVLPAAERADMGALVADLLVTKGTALSMARRTQEGLALIGAGRQMGEDLDAPMVTLRAITNAAFSMEWVSPRTAFDASREGVMLARRFGHRSSLNTLIFNALGAAIHLGEWAWATPLLEELAHEDLELVDQALGSAMVVSFRALRGEPHDELDTFIHQLDRTEPAVRAVLNTVDGYIAVGEGRDREALDFFQQDGWSEGAFDNTSWAAHVAAWTREDAALANAAEGLREAGRHGPPRDALELLIQADRAALAGSTRDAIVLYGRAIEILHELGLRLQEALTGIDVASLLDPSELEVQQAVQNSRVILSELGAIPLLERLSRAVAGSGDEAAGPTTTDAVPVSSSEIATS
jgi:tetratricopeptide (TPR) repeat protein